MQIDRRIDWVMNQKHNLALANLVSKNIRTTKKWIYRNEIAKIRSTFVNFELNLFDIRNMNCIQSIL